MFNQNNKGILPKKNNKKIKREILTQPVECTDMKMNLTAKDNDKLYMYENEKLSPIKVDTFEEKLLLFDTLITQSKNDIKDLTNVDSVRDYMIELLKVNIINRFKLINKLILFLHNEEYSLENTGAKFQDLEKLLNSNLWDFKPSKNEIAIADQEDPAKNNWDNWTINFSDPDNPFIEIEKEIMQQQEIKPDTNDYIHTIASLRNPRLQLWKDDSGEYGNSTWRDSVIKAKPSVIKGQLTRSINDMEDLLYPLKTRYILNPHKIVNILQLFPNNKPSRAAPKYQPPIQSIQSKNNTKKINVKPLNIGTRKKTNTVQELPVCIDYKKSFYDILSNKSQGDIANKNLLLHLNNSEALKNKEHEEYCCYKELYTVDTFDTLLDIKLQQLNIVQETTKNIILHDINEFEKKTWVNLNETEKINLLLDSIRESPIYGDNKFSDLMFKIAFQTKTDSNAPPLDKLQKLFPFFLDTKIVKEMICLCKKYTFLTLYSNKDNARDCKSKFTKSLRKKLREYLLKYKFKQYLDLFIRYLEDAITKTKLDSNKSKNIKIITDMLIKFREYHDKQIILTCNDVKTDTNITFEELTVFLEKNNTNNSSIEKKTRQTTHALNTFVKNESIKLAKITDSSEIFKYFNGISVDESMNAFGSNIINYFTNITNDASTLINFMESICMPDLMLNELLPFDIIINEMFDSYLNIFNSIMQYYFENYHQKNIAIQNVFELFSELVNNFIPIYNAFKLGDASSILIKNETMNAFGIVSWNISNQISGFSKLEQNSITGININMLQFITSLIEHFLNSEISTLILSIYGSLEKTNIGTNEIISTTLYSAFTSLLDAKESYVISKTNANLESLLKLFSKTYWDTLGSSISKLLYYSFSLSEIYEDKELNKLKYTYIPLTTITLLELNIKMNLYKLTIDNEKFVTIVRKTMAVTGAAAVANYLSSNETITELLTELYSRIKNDKTIQGPLMDNMSKILKHATTAYDEIEKPENINKNYFINTVMSILKTYSNIIEYTKLSNIDKVKSILEIVNPINYYKSNKKDDTSRSKINDTIPVVYYPEKKSGIFSRVTGLFKPEKYDNDTNSANSNSSSDINNETPKKTSASKIAKTRTRKNTKLLRKYKTTAKTHFEI